MESGQMTNLYNVKDAKLIKGGTGYGLNNCTKSVASSSEANRKQRQNVTNLDEKVILLWNYLYERRDFGVGALGREAFTSHRCRQDRCSLVTDRRMLNRSTAVVFHMRNELGPFPDHVNDRQLFAYFLLESPHHTYGASRRYRTKFNITMTYRLDSDIPVPISKLVQVEPQVTSAYRLKYPLSSRNSSVVWMVSHCGTPSKREKYASALAKHIDLDIYGACGKHTCAKSEPCMERFERQYMFYLSFENSYCQDYVTEKYYRTLKYEVIPIVYGRANYSAIGPQGAFINILDYRSPKDLARYLHYLANNQTAYVEYFQTRRYWMSLGVTAPAFCDLCELLHRPMYRRVYSDVHDWWDNGACDMNTVDKVIASTELD